MKELFKIAGLLISVAAAGLLFLFLLPIIVLVFVYMLVFGRRLPRGRAGMYGVINRRPSPDADAVDTYAQEISEENPGE